MHINNLKIKNAAVKFICLCVVLFTLSSCNGSSLSADDLLRPPKPTGDMNSVSVALEKSIGKDYTLKYPSMGNYHSAFIFCDLENKNDENYCLAFYSLNENSQNIHLSIVKKNNKKWEMAGDVSFDAQSIEKVLFADLTGNDKLDIVVGYSVYSKVDKKVAVLSFEKNKLRTRLEESYNVFTVCNLINDSKDQLFIANINASAEASAHIFSINESGVTELGNISLDKNITSFSEPQVSLLANDQSAIFLDAAKSKTEIATELIYFKDKKLYNPYFNKLTKQNTLNSRDSSVSVTDINGDGRLDIPVIGETIESFNDSSKSFTTDWINFNGSKNVVVQKTYMNILDGYYLNLTDEILNKLYITKQTDQRKCKVYFKDEKTGTVNFVFEIKVIASSEIENKENKNYFALSEKDGFSYIAYLTENGEKTGLDENSIQNMFSLISK